ncbi:MAG: glycosyltransferase, partial [Lachnospiraceae bacterium]|nr:glycosyltransferase [Lachnospiraceae bacterium]
DRVGRIRILGGEPLLNPELPKYVAMAREVYPEADIFVVTNGLLLNSLSEETCSVMRENGAAFMISYYPPLEGKLDDMKRRIEEKGVTVKSSPLIKEFTMRQNLHGKNDPKREFEACFQSSCNNLYKGRIAACMLPFMTHYFNETFEEKLPEDGAIDLYEEGLTTAELKKRLEKPFYRCAFCGDPVPVKWQQADREGNINDFVYGEQKNLLFITHQLSRTGAPIVFLDMIRIYREEGHRITVISLLDGPLRGEIEAMGIPVSIKDDFFADRVEFGPYAESFDAVFCNTLITYQVIHVLNGSLTPVIWWIHEGEQYFEYFKKVLPDFSKLSGNIRVLSVGHYVWEVIKRRYGVETGILHFGIKDSHGSRAGKVGAVDPQSRGLVRFVISGTYSKVKGQDVLCKAIRDLPGELMDRCEFIFCGNEENVDDEVFSEVVSLVRDYDNVKKYASLPREEMIEMMGTMDYLIVPSRIDPIPTVAAEAMMMHKPCIITDICGIAHYLKDGENALLCGAEDKDGLATKIGEAIQISMDANPSKYIDMAESAREIYDKHFSDKVFKPRILSLLSEERKKEKLIFTVGVYDILDIFTYEMIPEFERLGYETLLFDTSDMVHSLGKLYDFIKTPVKACITFNNLA